MGQRIGFEPDRHRFGVIVFQHMGAQLQRLSQALETALKARVTHRRKGWFGPRLHVLHFHQQDAGLTTSKAGDAELDISSMDDETRETLLEMLHQAEDFDRI